MSLVLDGANSFNGHPWFNPLTKKYGGILEESGPVGKATAGVFGPLWEITDPSSLSR
ncbi:hypothetical protein [Mesobacillus harenae]|uniref:hypothetical protein n=1 Tax=Mesobacillus harenae TaxID=2213203 RepID=UPI0015811DA1|nr:hypothetical protein [Mesobacillus harenae]